MTNQMPGACPAGHPGELDTNGINYRVWCKTCHWAGPEARESQAAIVAWNARHDHGCGMGPCDNNGCTSWSCQQYRAEGAEARAEEAERRAGAAETQLSEVVTPENEQNLRWHDEFGPIMRGSPDLPAFVVYLNNSAAALEAKLAAAESENARLLVQYNLTLDALVGSQRDHASTLAENARLKGELEKQQYRIYELAQEAYLEKANALVNKAQWDGWMEKARKAEGEVSRLKGELAHAEAIVAEHGATIDMRHAEIDRLKGEEVRLEGLTSPHRREHDLLRYMRSELADARLITHEEHGALISEGSGSARRLEDYDMLRGKLDAQAARISDLERERNFWEGEAERYTQNSEYAQSRLADAMLVIGALGLVPAAGGLHCKGVVYPGQLVMDAFERLGGKGEK